MAPVHVSNPPSCFPPILKGYFIETDKHTPSSSYLLYATFPARI